MCLGVHMCVGGEGVGVRGGGGGGRVWACMKVCMYMYECVSACKHAHVCLSSQSFL